MSGSTTRRDSIPLQDRPRRDRRHRQLREQPGAGRRVLPRRRPGRARARPDARRARRATTSATSSSSPPSTSTPTRSGSISARRSSASINNTIKFAEVPDLGVLVQRGPTFDGLGKFYREVVEESPAEPVDVAQALRDARADVLVSYLPVGSEDAQSYYAQACLDAGVGFVNAIPVFIASNPEWAQEVRGRGRADRRRRHQEPGRRDHHPPPARPALRRPRPRDRQHLPAQLRRQHGLQEHARARAAAVEEDRRRPSRSRARSTRASASETCTSARRTTCRGSTTASGPTSAWRAATSATCRSTSS